MDDMDAVDDGGGDDVTVETVDESDLPGAGGIFSKCSLLWERCAYNHPCWEKKLGHNSQQTRLYPVIKGSGSSGPTQNSNPDWLFSGFYSVVDIIQSNGWILLILLIGLWFAKQKLEEYLREKRRRDGEAAHAKDPDQLLDLVSRDGMGGNG